MPSSAERSRPFRHMNLRLDETLCKHLEQQAQRTQRSIAGYIRHLIVSDRDQHQQPSR